ncbi:unnamed protein product, partial [Mesorhabditis spiculigera]
MPPTSRRSQKGDKQPKPPEKTASTTKPKRKSNVATVSPAVVTMPAVLPLIKVATGLNDNDDGELPVTPQNDPPSRVARKTPARTKKMAVKGMPAPQKGTRTKKATGGSTARKAAHRRKPQSRGASKTPLPDPNIRLFQNGEPGQSTSGEQPQQPPPPPVKRKLDPFVSLPPLKPGKCRLLELCGEPPNSAKLKALPVQLATAIQKHAADAEERRGIQQGSRDEGRFGDDPEDDVEKMLLKRVNMMKSKGLWSGAMLPRSVAPPRRMTVWDQMLKEVVMMHRDFKCERIFANKFRKQIGKEVVKFHADLKQAEKRRKEERKAAREALVQEFYSLERWRPKLSPYVYSAASVGERLSRKIVREHAITLLPYKYRMFPELVEIFRGELHPYIGQYYVREKDREYNPKLRSLRVRCDSLWSTMLTSILKATGSPTIFFDVFNFVLDYTQRTIALHLLQKPPVAPQLPNPSNSLEALCDGTREFAGPLALNISGKQFPNRMDFAHAPYDFLRGYQHAGLNWLLNLHQKGISGILADESGLGKRRQIATLFALIAPCEKPNLIVCAPDFVDEWVVELKKTAPELKVTVCFNLPDLDMKMDVIIVAFTKYLEHAGFMTPLPVHRWNYQVFDEPLNIDYYQKLNWAKLGPLDAQTQMAKYRVLLRRKPLPSDPFELIALCQFIFPDWIQQGFERKGQNLVDWLSSFNLVEAVDAAEVDGIRKRLLQIINPYVLRRTKKEVEKQLPKNREVVVRCQLYPHQRILYDEYQSLPRSRSDVDIITAATGLWKICNHPDVFEEMHNNGSYLLEMERTHLPGALFDLDAERTEFVERHFLRRIVANVGYEPLRPLRRGPICPRMGHYRFVSEVDAERRPNAFKMKRRKETEALLYRKLLRRSKEDALNDELWTSPITGLRYISVDDYDEGTKRLLPFKHFVSIKQMYDWNRELLDPLPGLFEHTLLKSQLKLVRWILYSPPAVRVSNNFRPGQGRMSYYRILDEAHDKYHAWASANEGTQRALPCQDLADTDPFPNALHRLSVMTSTPVGRSSGKLDALAVLLRDLRWRNHKIMIYTQMTEMVHRLRWYLDQKGFSNVWFGEHTPMIQDYALQKHFEDDKRYVIGIAAAGCGRPRFRFPGVDTIIFYDCDWNLKLKSDELYKYYGVDYATPTTIYRFIAEGTVEEVFLKHQLRDRSYRMDYSVPGAGKLFEQVSVVNRAIDTLLNGKRSHTVLEKLISNVNDIQWARRPQESLIKMIQFWSLNWGHPMLEYDMEGINSDPIDLTKEVRNIKQGLLYGGAPNERLVTRRLRLERFETGKVIRSDEPEYGQSIHDPWGKSVKRMEMQARHPKELTYQWDSEDDILELPWKLNPKEKAVLKKKLRAIPKLAPESKLLNTFYDDVSYGHMYRKQSVFLEDEDYPEMTRPFLKYRLQGRKRKKAMKRGKHDNGDATLPRRADPKLKTPAQRKKPGLEAAKPTTAAKEKPGSKSAMPITKRMVNGTSKLPMKAGPSGVSAGDMPSTSRAGGSSTARTGRIVDRPPTLSTFKRPRTPPQLVREHADYEGPPWTTQEDEALQKAYAISANFEYISTFVGGSSVTYRTPLQCWNRVNALRNMARLPASKAESREKLTTSLQAMQSTVKQKPNILRRMTPSKQATPPEQIARLQALDVNVTVNQRPAELLTRQENRRYPSADRREGFNPNLPSTSAASAESGLWGRETRLEMRQPAIPCPAETLVSRENTVIEVPPLPRPMPTLVQPAVPEPRPPPPAEQHVPVASTAAAPRRIAVSNVPTQNFTENPPRIATFVPGSQPANQQPIYRAIAPSNQTSTIRTTAQRVTLPVNYNNAQPGSTQPPPYTATERPPTQPIRTTAGTAPRVMQRVPQAGPRMVVNQAPSGERPALVFSNPQHVRMVQRPVQTRRPSQGHHAQPGQQQLPHFQQQTPVTMLIPNRGGQIATPVRRITNQPTNRMVNVVQMVNNPGNQQPGTSRTYTAVGGANLPIHSGAVQLSRRQIHPGRTPIISVAVPPNRQMQHQGTPGQDHGGPYAIAGQMTFQHTHQSGQTSTLTVPRLIAVSQAPQTQHLLQQPTTTTTQNQPSPPQTGGLPSVSTLERRT